MNRRSYRRIERIRVALENLTRHPPETSQDSRGDAKPSGKPKGQPDTGSLRRGGLYSNSQRSASTSVSKMLNWPPLFIPTTIANFMSSRISLYGLTNATFRDPIIC